MPKLAFTVPTQLTADQAATHLRGFIPQIREHYKDQVKDVTETWTGNTLDFSFKTLGFVFKGTLAAADNKVDVSMDLPLAAMMVKGRIEQEVRTGLERLLK
ncbi:MAG TPA: polyhydroxyalkanoic acid system family protein [Pirellulales bacterium]|jgi:hypothetical protein|nr:polyhydroxyalkanoic acid system family protein [Pirellulales bacterium]